MKKRLNCRRRYVLSCVPVWSGAVAQAPLEDWSCERLEKFVRSMGQMYGKLADTIKGGGITGEFAATLQESDISVDVSNPMLRRRVLQEFARLRREHRGAFACARVVCFSPRVWMVVYKGASR